MPVQGSNEKPNIGEIIVVCDADNVIRFVSRSFSRLFGAKVEDWHGQEFAPGNRTATPGRPARYKTESKLAGADIIIRWTETVLSGGERLYTGMPAGAGGGNDPLAEQPSPETASDNESRGLQVLATMSHEMRTPLNGILGMTNLLLDTPLAANQRSYAESVRESGAALLALINDLLDYSKIEAGSFDLEQTAFDVRKIVQNVTELLASKAYDKGIEMTAFVDPMVPETLFGDEARLRQVFINLVGNAVKFTKTGGVCLAIELQSGDDEVAEICFRVHDTGIGIPAEIQKKIFDEFSQGDTDAKARREGTGLGLSIAQKIVKSMDGEITVESEPGTGSTFSFTLTLDHHESKRPAPTDVHNNMVVVSDNPVLNHTLKRQLASLGATTVTIANTVDEAHGALAAHANAVLFCDLGIAQSHGSELAQAANKAYLLTSPRSREAIEQMRVAGFDGYFIKPIRQSSLAVRLAQLGRAQTEPLPDPVDETPADPLPPKEIGEKEDKAFRILLAEDNQINAVLATAIIKRAGHNVVVARNGREAVEALTKNQFDLVLMDLHMPELDGFGATIEIRALENGMSAIPIVALTASAHSADRERCEDAGMNGFLTKPFDPDELTDIIQKWAGTANPMRIAS